MSNASLKDQLEALSLAAKTPPAEKKQNVKKQSRPDKNSAKPKPAWLEHAQYGVELLKAHFPLCFRDIKDIKPLKKGIKQDLVKLLGTLEIVIGDKACMVSSLAYYVNSIAYHKSVVAGAERIDLEGNNVGIVTAEEAQYSIDCHKAKLHKKKVPQPTTKKTEQA